MNQIKKGLCSGLRVLHAPTRFISDSSRRRFDDFYGERKEISSNPNVMNRSTVGTQKFIFLICLSDGSGPLTFHHLRDFGIRYNFICIWVRLAQMNILDYFMVRLSCLSSKPRGRLYFPRSCNDGYRAIKEAVLYRAASCIHICAFRVSHVYPRGDSKHVHSSYVFLMDVLAGLRLVSFKTPYRRRRIL